MPNLYISPRRSLTTDFYIGRFWKPELVVREMQNVKTSTGRFLFNIDEWLTTSQVRSYFSRMRLGTIKKSDQQPSHSNSTRSSVINNEYQQENDLDEDADDDAEVDIPVSNYAMYMNLSL